LPFSLGLPIIPRILILHLRQEQANQLRPLFYIDTPAGSKPVNFARNFEFLVPGKHCKIDSVTVEPLLRLTQWCAILLIWKLKWVLSHFFNWAK
jgi:hypothetical protein